MIHLRRPLSLALLCFTAGLLLALRFALPLQPLLFLSVACFLGTAIAALSPTRPVNAYKPSPQLGLLFGLIGGLAGSAGGVQALHDCRTMFEDSERIRVAGDLGAAHRLTDGAASPLLPLTRANVTSVPLCSGDLRIRLPRGQQGIPLGARLEVAGEWRQFTAEQRSRWPSDPRSAGYLSVDSVINLTPGDPPLGLRMRRAVDQRIEKLFPAHGEMMEALVLGRREYVDQDVLDRYTRSGLVHLLAISGMHVGLIAGALLLLCGAARFSRRRAILLTIAATWLYLVAIGAAPSALRSGIMITLSLLAGFLQRPAAAAPIVAAAALLILAFQPLAILDPGFQLSFAGILALLFFRAPLLTLAPDRISRRKLLHATFEALALGLAAFVVTAPIVAHHFHVISPISIIAGLPATPLVSLALVGSVSALAADPLLPPLARLLADGAALCLDMVDAVAGYAATIPYGNSKVPAPPWWSWAVATAIGVAAGNWKHTSSRRLRWIIGTGSCIAVLVVWPVFSFIRGNNGFEVHFIDVGQGDAIALRTPANRWILIDAGPASTDYDAGERRVLPFLRSKGARRLEALILTHPDMDHIGGAPAVLEELPVTTVFEPGQAVGKAVYVDLLAAIEGEGTVWRAARTGRTLDLDGVRIDFLWPDAEAVDAYEDANQISAMMRISYGDFSLLLTGDAGSEIEEIVMRRNGDALAADVLKLGHHGSTTSTAAAFLDVVDPELAVVSAGRRNRYGHPAASVMDRVLERQIAVARTDQDGSVTLLVEPGGTSWRREEW